MRLLFTLLLVLCFALPSPARAGKDSQGTELSPVISVKEEGEQPVSIIGTDGAGIIIDPNDNSVRIIIDGQETIRIDAAGLHVRENIDYGGQLTDYGRTGFDDRAGWEEYQRLIAEARDEQ